MTKQETAKVLAMMREIFPSGKEITQDTVNAWHWVIGEYDYRVAEQAVRELATSYEGYSFPTPAHLVKKMKCETGDCADYGKLWDRLVRAAKNSTYGAKEEFEKLPPEVKAFVGTPTVLQDFGMVEPNVLQTVIKANFTKQIPMIVERHEVQNRLPAEVMQAINESKIKTLEGELK